MNRLIKRQRREKREDAVIPASGERMPRGARLAESEMERIPFGGWRELPGHAAKVKIAMGKKPLLVALSVWYRNQVMVVSALEIAEAPDRRGDAIPQWHISIAGKNRRATQVETEQALVCFGMADAEEDNHHPGGQARHFWKTIDPARRVDCECKTDEKTIVEPDGYRSTTPVDGPCSGCELAAKKRELGTEGVCPLHPEAAP